MLELQPTQSTVDIEELVDDFVTYYIAGQETTSNLLSFAVAMVHTHPTVLERLQAEVKEVLGEETNITKELLQKLEYTEQVLLETLRMHPPVPGIGKEVAPEGLDVGGYHVPGGTSLMLPLSVLCRMPEYFDEPDTFNPDRFSPENTQ
ncbi:cholesterol 24-hydroxylase-like [Halichondria panicea]|uniref:cholesterol 24-hydroxylase-like n=1 Tax=Halichondria panicea TaxID=6063 RepID=UPI00312B2B39